MTTAVLTCALAGALLACSRPDDRADVALEAELAGAWVRAEPVERGIPGFELVPGGRLLLLNTAEPSGVAWNVGRGELVVSTLGERSPQPVSERLHIALSDGVSLSLGAESPSAFAGTYRRAHAERIAGIVTYLESIALPADARVVVELRRGERVLARTRIAAPSGVPIAFLLSHVAEGAEPNVGLALEASISSAGQTLFATRDPVPVPRDASAVELIVRSLR